MFTVLYALLYTTRYTQLTVTMEESYARTFLGSLLKTIYFGNEIIVELFELFRLNKWTISYEDHKYIRWSRNLEIIQAGLIDYIPEKNQYRAIAFNYITADFKARNLGHFKMFLDTDISQFNALIYYITKPPVKD